MSPPKPKHDAQRIAVNRRARFDYHLEETFQAGLVLLGWEVKSLRAGRVQINDTHVHLRRGEAWLFNAIISPLPSACTYTHPEPSRSRKLLLKRQELNRLVGAVERKGYTLIPLELRWVRGRVKLIMALAKGKKLHDKRATEKDRDWKRQQARMLKHR